MGDVAEERGVPVLKVRGDYLAVATLGLGEIVRVIVLSDAAAPLLDQTVRGREA